MAAIDQQPQQAQPEAAPARPNIFISYTSRDRTWAHWIGVTLRDNGYNPFVHEWEVGAGENLARWMDESIEAADRLLGVFTDAYVKALYSSSERWAAYWDDPQGRKGFLVPVEVEPVAQWPPTTRALKRLSLVGLSEAEAERALLEFLPSPSPPSDRPVFPGGSQTGGLSSDRPKSPDPVLLSQAEPLPETRPVWPAPPKEENVLKSENKGTPMMEVPWYAPMVLGIVGLGFGFGAGVLYESFRTYESPEPVWFQTNVPADWADHDYASTLGDTPKYYVHKGAPLCDEKHLGQIAVCWDNRRNGYPSGVDSNIPNIGEEPPAWCIYKAKSINLSTHPDGPSPGLVYVCARPVPGAH
jgi:hypothetical protein